jgi:UDP-3-O-[3-hydroxymyristoyl] glucosamine N-acyltransferase
MIPTLAELAASVGGTVFGDGNIPISGVAPVQSATLNEITFLERPDRLTLLKKCNAGAVVVPLNCEVENFATIQTDNVLQAFEKIALFFSPQRQEYVPGISGKAVIHPSAKIGQNVSIGHFAVIEEDTEIADNVVIHSGVQIAAGCKIGEETQIFPNVVLYRDTVIGGQCIIHANTVIGAYGFGYDSSTGSHILSAQLGNVIIGDNVEIGANSTVDRATYGSTIIGDGTKIDNFVMIAHNCKIGKHNLLCAHTGIAGSTTTGDYVIMAGRVGVKDHVHIGNRAVLGAMAGILADVPEDARLVGIPATPEKEQMRIQIALQALPEMRKEFKQLVKTVEELKNKAI